MQKSKIVSFSFVIFIAFLIFSVSSMTFDSGPAGKFDFKPIAYHISVFFLLSGFLFVFLGISRETLGVGVIASILYAFSDEFHQYFVPGRFFGGFDILLDLAGIGFALLVFLAFYYVR